MSTITVKQIKEDAIINVKVNNHYHAMVKALIYNLFFLLKEKGATDESLQNIINKKYEDLSALEQSFYTVTLLLGEIERQADLNGQIEEKEIDKSVIEKAIDNIEPKD